MTSKLKVKIRSAITADLGAYRVTVFPQYLRAIHLSEFGDDEFLEFGFDFESRRWSAAVFSHSALKELENNTAAPSGWDERDWAAVDKMRKALAEGIEL